MQVQEQDWVYKNKTKTDYEGSSLKTPMQVQEQK